MKRERYNEKNGLLAWGKKRREYYYTGGLARGFRIYHEL